MISQLDMFDSPQPADPVVRPRPKAKVLSNEDMAQRLASTGDYKILRRLPVRDVVANPRPGFPRIGLLVDTETTGLDHRAAEVIEIGMVAFTYNDDGAFGDVIGIFGGMQQPSKPIPPEITELTGITDEMVAGQAIDIRAMEELLLPADLVIAHNAGFDRTFCEKLSDRFRTKAWACSHLEVDWKGRGFEGSKLGYLLGQCGYFHDGHRAVDDCLALLEVLLHGSEPALPGLIRTSQRTMARIWAEYAPFDQKDRLKAKGYRWADGTNGTTKAWWAEVAADDLEAELHWLRTQVYLRAEADPPVQMISAVDRYRK
ncbi:MAG: 3'-5' exonuclease [Asticcacaulis sp.]|nr:3'-5' exonuclease [Asticcacaulis sp.]